jgi:hypothetical protein
MAHFYCVLLTLKGGKWNFRVKYETRNIRLNLYKKFVIDGSIFPMKEANKIKLVRLLSCTLLSSFPFSIVRCAVLTSSSCIYIVIRKCYTQRRAHNTIISSPIRPFRASVAQTLRIFPNKLAFLSALVLFAACVVGVGGSASVYIAAAALIGLSELIGSKMQLRQPCVCGVECGATQPPPPALGCTRQVALWRSAIEFAYFAWILTSMRLFCCYLRTVIYIITKNLIKN